MMIPITMIRVLTMAITDHNMSKSKDTRNELLAMKMQLHY